ncbi:MAG: hypothetical protein Q4B03_01465 [Lachnospiraceae bacterium]|nr:hypothetical protein [Lachnospiraceae bacterium]
MAKTVQFAASPADDERLAAMWEQLEDMKNNLAELIQDYDGDDDVDEEQLDALTEVLDALEDAWDIMGDVLNEG